MIRSEKCLRRALWRMERTSRCSMAAKQRTTPNFLLLLGFSHHQLLQQLLDFGMGVGIRFHDDGLGWVSGLGSGWRSGSGFGTGVGVQFWDRGPGRGWVSESRVGVRFRGWGRGIGSGSGLGAGVWFWDGGQDRGRVRVLSRRLGWVLGWESGVTLVPLLNLDPKTRPDPKTQNRC
ncbi:hypothetical protein TIFTF001_012372 [Ficus carica]|uniref:Uncharacterized protein n=1 Tax=Ficus carica TaxID=3494 RepID=A0AA88D678_FICCA|nr:hypothetical protein TIFTF001_012372 [Ficus carica]